MTAHHIHRFIAFAFALCCLLIGEGLAAGEQPSTPPDRIAVIPFANITGNTADDWIGIGIAETLTVELERATSRTVIRMNDDRLLNNGTQEAVVSAGRELNVRWIVSGSYQRMGEQLRLTGRLIESTSGDVLRSARIEGPWARPSSSKRS